MTAPPLPTIDDRLLRLEEKLTCTEDLVDELNRVVVRQQQLLEALARELTRQRRQVEELSELTAPGGRTSLADERPPHY